ncbi:MAG: hypothetical protein H6711_03850 [Myxococcales bacterium]|nr:hypothetical protein [Myxococcales bacterium]
MTPYNLTPQQITGSLGKKQGRAIIFHNRSGRPLLVTLSVRATEDGCLLKVINDDPKIKGQEYDVLRHASNEATAVFVLRIEPDQRILANANNDGGLTYAIEQALVIAL